MDNISLMTCSCGMCDTYVQLYIYIKKVGYIQSLREMCIMQLHISSTWYSPKLPSGFEFELQPILRYNSPEYAEMAIGCNLCHLGVSENGICPNVWCCWRENDGEPVDRMGFSHHIRVPDHSAPWYLVGTSLCPPFLSWFGNLI